MREGRRARKNQRDLTGSLFPELEAGTHLGKSTRPGSEEQKSKEQEAEANKILERSVFHSGPGGQKFFGFEIATSNPPLSYRELAERYNASDLLDLSQFIDEYHPSLEKEDSAEWKQYITGLARRQLEGIDLFLQSKGRFLLQANTGKGKTPMALATLGCEFARQAYNSLLVPRHVLAAQQIERIQQFLPSVELIVLGQRSADQRRKLYARLHEDLKLADPPKRLLIFTEVLANDLESKNGAPALLNPELLGTLVVDEAHKSVGNAGFARVAAALQGADNRVLLLTATPGKTPQDLEALCKKWEIKPPPEGGRWAMRLPDEPKLRQEIQVPLSPESKPIIRELENCLYQAVVLLGRGLPQQELSRVLSEEISRYTPLRPGNVKDWLRGLFFEPKKVMPAGNRIMAGNPRFKIPSLKNFNRFFDYIQKQFQSERNAGVKNSESVWGASASRASAVTYLRYILDTCVSSGEFSALASIEKQINDAQKDLQKHIKPARWKRDLLLDIEPGSQTALVNSEKPLGSIYQKLRTKHERLEHLRQQLQSQSQDAYTASGDKNELKREALNILKAGFPKLNVILDQVLEDPRLSSGAIIRSNLVCCAELIHEALSYDPRSATLGIRSAIMRGGLKHAKDTNQARKDFVNGKIQILVASSVIDEGLDTPAMLGVLVEPQPEARVNTQFAGRISRPNFEGNRNSLVGRLITLATAHPIDQRKLRAAKRGLSDIERTNSEI